MRPRSPSTARARCMFPQGTTGRCIALHPTAQCRLTLRAWALPLVSLSIASRTFMLVTAVARVLRSLAGKRGIVRITPEGKANLEVAGHGLVGLAFAPGRSVVLATTSAVHHLSWNVQGQVLLP